jgi:hypothetical protein
MAAMSLRATAIALCLVASVTGCDQFVRGTLVRLENQTGEQVTILTEIDQTDAVSCKVPPGADYLMTVGKTLKVRHGDGVWFYGVPNEEEQEVVELVKCGRSGAFTPNVPTWQMKPDGRIDYVPAGAGATSTAASTPPNGFPMQPTPPRN